LPFVCMQPKSMTRRFDYSKFPHNTERFRKCLIEFISMRLTRN
jgi:hypothetical protein